MKKFLTMALALMMVLSLFAVPTMAAANDLVVNGDFDDVDLGAIPTTQSTTAFRAINSSTSASVVNIAAEGLPANGSSVNALKISNKTAGQITDVRTNTLAIAANTVYKVSFDYLIAEEALPTVGYGVGASASPYFSEDGTDWGSSKSAYSYADAETKSEIVDGTEVFTAVTGKWATHVIYLKADTALTYIKFVAHNGFNGKFANNKKTTVADSEAGVVWYLDNVSVTEFTGTEPSSFNVTISGDAGANVSVASATSEGEAVNYTVTPQFGYYIASVTVGGTDVTAAVDAYKGGTYSTGAIEADTAIVVRTASYAANDKGVSTDVATLPSAFASTASTVTFGKVLDDSATSYGVELTQNGQPVLTYHGGGPLYKANNKNANGQYAVEFVGLPAGEYTVRTYVIVNGTKTFGAPATFVVE